LNQARGALKIIGGNRMVKGFKLQAMIPFEAPKGPVP